MLFAVLIYDVEGVFERLPDEEQAAILGKHRAVQSMLKEKDAYRGAVRLMPASTAVHVREKAEQVLVLDGPFAESKEQIAGLYLVEAESMDLAVEAAKALPQGIAHMEVRPVAWGAETLSR